MLVKSSFECFIIYNKMRSTIKYFHFSIQVLIDFSLTVKAATLIFISGRVSTFPSAKQGKSGSIYNLVKINKLFEPRNRACIS